MTYYLNFAAAAALGIVGYSFMIKAPLRSVLPALLVGLVGTASYVLMDTFGASSFISNLVAALVMSVGSHVVAVIMKAPENLFLFPSVVILVPGKFLYLCMNNIIMGNYAESWKCAMETMKIAAGIVDGLICGMIAISIYKRIREIIVKPKKKKHKPAEN